MTSTPASEKSGSLKTIEVTSRDSGKSKARAARLISRVPGIVYGPELKPLTISTAELAIQKLMAAGKHEATIFTLKSDVSALNGRAVLVRSIQRHPVTRRPQHIDFYAVDMNSKIRVHVAIRLEGKALGLSEGGVLDQQLRELEIECLPKDIPDAVVADVSPMGVNTALHVSDLKVPDSIRVLSFSTLTVATVSIPQDVKPTAVTPDAGAAGAAPAAGGAAGAAAPAAAAGGAAKGAAPAAGKGGAAAPAAAKGGDKKK